MRLSTLATAIASSFSFSMKWERTFSNSSAEIRTISSLVLLRTTVERDSCYLGKVVIGQLKFVTILATGEKRGKQSLEKFILCI